MPTERPIELWAGFECTVNRVRDRWLDQVKRSGHWDRPHDLDLLPELGVRAARYPILWEHVAPHGDLGRADWRWVDGRLAILNAHGVRPIAGLLHHGSGPAHTNLLDPDFPLKLAAYARAVARRYPWLEDYTPVNEPLTTARFSALYGLWYPHAKDDASLARALYHQIAGIAAAMRAIREVNPAARLIQTEDYGLTTSTPKLAYQAEFENRRRWLSLDLLFGRVTKDHPLRGLMEKGVPSEGLDALAAEPCPPDVVGLNYYVTSDRWLDEREELYAPEFRGGNERDRYADIDSPRAAASPGSSGHYQGLKTAWERYGRPVALTEVHIDAAREDQLRWLGEAWEAAERLRSEGGEVKAVTYWALLGSYDWNRLCTVENGYYEPGAFDLRNPGSKPRPTAVARMLGALGRGERFEHPLLTQPGWWRRPCRVAGGPFAPAAACEPLPPGDRPLLIAGAGGTLGRAFARLCAARAIPFVGLRRAEMDAADEASVEAALERFKPWAVVNAAGYVDVDRAERESERCFRENVQGAAIVAAACARRGLPLLTFSSDLVFGGDKRQPYVESDAPKPVNVYGVSKARAEERVAKTLPSALIVRSSAFFGPWDDANFLCRALDCWETGAAYRADERQIVTPTWVPDLVRHSLDLLIDGESGVWHLACPEALTWLELAHRLADLVGRPRSLIVPLDGERAARAPRPDYSALGSARGLLLPPLDHCLKQLVERRTLERPAPQEGRR